jgi:undecaprenyl-diphosphatase
LVVDIARAISHIGDTLVVIAIAVAAGVWLFRRQSRRFALVPLAALALASLTETIAKQLIERPRPPDAYHLVAEHNSAFPSGHTTAAAALLLAIALVLAPRFARPHLRFAVIGGCGLVAAGVGAARLVLGVHWLTDVVAGWFLGAAWALGVVLIAEQLESRRRAGPTAPA